MKETRHFSATQLLSAGVDLSTVAGRLGHAEGSTTLRYYAQFTRPADQRAASVIPAQLDELRKKERLRALFRQLPDVPYDLAGLAATLGPQAGLTAEAALPWLAALAEAWQANGRSTPRSAARSSRSATSLLIKSRLIASHVIRLWAANSGRREATSRAAAFEAAP